MAPSTQVTLQDNLVKFENLLTGLELLSEEIRTRKEFILTDESLERLFTDALQDDERMRSLAGMIVNRMGNTAIVNAVTRKVKQEIEQHIDAYLDRQLAEPSIEARIEKLIQNRAAGISAAPMAPEEPPLEQLTYDSVDDIASRFRILSDDVVAA